MVSTTNTSRRAAGIILSTTLAIASVAAPATMAFAAGSQDTIVSGPAATLTAKTGDAAKTSIADVKIAVDAGKEEPKPAKDWGLKAGDYTTGVWKVDEGHDKLTMHVYDKDGKTVVATGTASKTDTIVKFTDKDGKALDKVTLADDTTVGFTGFGTVSLEYTPAATTTPDKPAVKGDANGDGKADAKDLTGLTAQLVDDKNQPTGKYVHGFDATAGDKDYQIPEGQNVKIDGTVDGWTVSSPTADDKGVITVTASTEDGVKVTWTFTPAKDASGDDKPSTPDTDKPATDPFAGFTDDEKATLNTMTVTDDKGKPVDWFKATQLEYWKLTADQFKQAPSVGVGGGNPTQLEASSDGYYDKDGKQIKANEDGTIPENAVTYKYVIKGKTSGKSVTYVFSTLDKPADDGTDKPDQKDSYDVVIDGNQMFKADTAKELGIPAGDYTPIWTPGAKPSDAKLSIGGKPAGDGLSADPELYKGEAKAEGGAFALTDKDGKSVDHVTIEDDTYISIAGQGTATFVKWTGQNQKPDQNDDTNKPVADKTDGDGSTGTPNKLAQTGMGAGIALIGSALGLTGLGFAGRFLSRRRNAAK